MSLFVKDMLWLGFMHFCCILGMQFKITLLAFKLVTVSSYYIDKIFTEVIQMMLPVLSSESFVYHYMQNPAVVRDMIRPSIYSDNSEF